MKIHTLKITPRFYEKVMEGKKTFEFRKNDRNYQVGDLIHFIAPDGSEFEEDTARFEIKYILKSKDFEPCLKDYVVFSIERIN